MEVLAFFVERHRKKKINSGINRIGELIPCSPALKQSKNMILDQAWKYITELKRQNDELLLNGGNKEQADEIKRLRKQLYEIQKENGRYIELLKANDICLYDDPTIHWRGNLKNAKVPVVIPTEKVQKSIIVYSNGSQLGVNGQSASVQGITFNMGHNLQKQTANVVPVQRTCNLVTPVTISAVYTTESKSLNQTSISVSSTSQEGPLCLPLTIPAQNIPEVSTLENKQSSFATAIAGCQGVSQAGTAHWQQCSSSISQQEQHISESDSRQQNSKLSKVTVFSNTNTSSVSSVLNPEVPHKSLPCSDLQDSGKDFQESLLGSATDTALVQPMEVGIANSFPSVNAKTSTDESNARAVVTSTVAIQTLSTEGTISAGCLDTWSFSTSLPASCLSSDLKNVRSLKRIPSTGNTQTTWTTLQLSGNTVQPLNHTPSSIIPTLLHEPVNNTSSTSAHNRQSFHSVGLNNSLACGQPIEQVAGTFISCPSLSMQPLIAQPQLQTQSRTNILPINSAMQVIQMTQPVGPAVGPTPTNQNVIILQPPNTTPCPPVIRAEAPNQTVGQQIVIIQAANPNPLSLFSAQTPSSVRMPLHAVSSVACPNNALQNASAPHAFGGKHLVHILPRPSSSSASSSAQSLSVSVPTHQQQPPTISLNGQLFALQPVMSSSGASNQTPMQIIQPTTSEDPNTNVALNTFGALANLSQSISQMAGQNCLQVAIHHSTNPSATVSGQAAPVNCVSVSTTATSSTITENSTALPIISNPVNSSSAKSHAGSQSFAKPKKANKNSNAKKQSTPSKESVSGNKAGDEEKIDLTNVDVSKQHSNGEVKILLENASLSPETSIVCRANNMVSQTGENSSVTPFKEILNAENVVLSSPGSECNLTNVSGSSLSKSGTIRHLESVTSEPKVSTSLLPECSTQNESSQTPVSSELSKSCVTSIITITSTEPSVSGIHISEASANQNCTQKTCISEAISTSQPSVTQESSAEIETAADFLEGQGLSRMLSDIEKEKPSAEKNVSLTLESSSFSTKSAETNVLPEKQEIILLNTEGENITPQHSCISDQEGSGSALLGTRQADSPMSTSSGSSRSFSVASMLPDTSRDDMANTSSHTFSGCTFSDHTDIVGMAARAIFAQENLERGRVSMQVDIGDAASRTAEVLSLTTEHHQCVKAQSCKDNSALQIEATPRKFNSQDLAQTTNAGGLISKPNCSVGIETSNVSSQFSTSANVTSLSINNLIHQGSITHPFVSCSNLSQPSVQPAVSISSSSYVSQSSRPSLLAEYSQDKFQPVRASVMQMSQIPESHLKQTNESRKDSTKRIVQDDLLLSTAKRQKQCRAPSMRLEGISSINRTSDSLGEQTKLLVSHIASNSSSSVVSVNSQEHTDSLNPLFTSSSTFMNTSLRQTDIHCNSQQPDIHCNSQPPISEQPQQGQTGSQHLQHVPAQTVSHIHSSNPYLKQQQQQTGQIREMHHLFQQQHVSHTESSVHSQPHNVHQQRAIQEVQMQKKHTLIQGTQPAQLSLQQKHHAADQVRQKGSQPHPHHQQIQQQMQQHYGASQPDKSCENPATNRSHHTSHPPSHLSQDMHQQPQDVGNRQQGSGISSEHISGHNQIQRVMTSRGMEQQMVCQPSIVSRSSNVTCTPHRQERNRVSSYSAEALIGKTPSNSEQRMGPPIQGPRVSDQLDMRSYLDVSRNKGLVVHNMQSHTSVDHNISADVQRLSDCQTFKGSSQQPQSTFEVQTSGNNEMGNIPVSLRNMQSQTFRIGQNIGPTIDRQKRLPYPQVQGIPTANVVPPRENENSCHQSFMQSLLAPHLEQVSGNQRSVSDHQRNTQCGQSATLEYSCPPAREGVHLRRDSEGQTRESCDMAMGTINSRNNSLNIPFSSSSGEIQGRNSSPHVSVQKSNPMRMADSQGAKNRLNAQVSSNMHGVVRPPLPHPSISRGSADQGQTSVRQPNSSVTQRSRHHLQDTGSSKIRRSGVQRHGNVFDPSLPHLPLASSGSMILGRQQSTTEKRASIVRFMSDNSQVSNDNTTDQHTLSQNFGFPFIPEGSINPPINTNPSFIPPVTQPGATRTPALIPVDPQNTLPSFYPPYSPAHPSLSNDISIPYFSNQMFTNPSTEKSNSAGLNNRFGSILSPPRPVGFAQPSFPLLPDIPPMPMANPSHLSNFNLTSLFPEIVTLPPDGSAMSPLLSVSNASASDSSKQSSNRPAHNISHILGHDCSSAV
ncbi:basic helix-loop-helix domain-containing protein USF3 isoform X2 [Microcaecilia unicolor]|uniref:Basic helix-loop-helix domain-containing protein USF3 isoform X2 n=1 Tax=Microcaecilia unicolor TaxID=1415580 RepID=A0A6P7Y4F3_9AMPH|nr:basic helix-loop-helix domain-containing protein USF3 isoform X2 [Microcaecilia unicolor]